MRKRPTRADLRALARFGKTFGRAGFKTGCWVVEPGTMPWFAESPEVSAFVETLYDGRIFLNFPWAAWADEWAALEANSKAVACADLTTVRKALTAHVRADRFCSGHLAAAIADGRVPRLLSRLAQFAESH
jgi:O-acetyl-ADP-ribose deacetylase